MTSEWNRLHDASVSNGEETLSETHAEWRDTPPQAASPPEIKPQSSIAPSSPPNESWAPKFPERSTYAEGVVAETHDPKAWEPSR